MPRVCTWLAVLLIVAAAQVAGPMPWSGWKLEKLRATHERIESLKKELRKVSLTSGYDDVRALLHVHSAFSHDSRGTIDEIVAAAKQVGVPRDHVHRASGQPLRLRQRRPSRPERRRAVDSRRRDRRLSGLSQAQHSGREARGPAAVRRPGRGTDGLIFLCHLEERMDWEIAGLTGSEIYNTHADFKDETKFMAALRSPLTLLGLRPAVKQYPQETFAALAGLPGRLPEALRSAVPEIAARPASRPTTRTTTRPFGRG